MEDSFRIRDYLTKQNPKSALIVGAGYIGVEMADALTHRGLEVTLASRPPAVLSTVDQELGALIEQESEAHGVHLWTGVHIVQVESADGQLRARSSSGEEKSEWPIW
jgi:pyruvate/2-oxoglutarate dehydrogenase complex dihydrolipoamide dehydrogenase (E3) component